MPGGERHSFQESDSQAHRLALVSPGAMPPTVRTHKKQPPFASAGRLEPRDSDARYRTMRTERTLMDAPAKLAAEEGFAAKAVTPDLARRQLNVSLGVMGVLVGAGLAIFSTLSLPPERTPVELRAQATIQQPHFVRPMTGHASDTASTLPDG